MRNPIKCLQLFLFSGEARQGEVMDELVSFFSSTDKKDEISYVVSTI